MLRVEVFIDNGMRHQGDVTMTNKEINPTKGRKRKFLYSPA
jgi:hypothetical protein